MENPPCGIPEAAAIRAEKTRRRDMTRLWTARSQKWECGGMLLRKCSSFLRSEKKNPLLVILFQHSGSIRNFLAKILTVCNSNTIIFFRSLIHGHCLILAALSNIKHNFPSPLQLLFLMCLSYALMRYQSTFWSSCLSGRARSRCHWSSRRSRRPSSWVLNPERTGSGWLSPPRLRSLSLRLLKKKLIEKPC